MLEFGYVRLYRSLLNWEWYTDEHTKTVFLHLILTANYETQQWRGITVERGQRIYSRASLAQELRMSERSIRTALNHLISTGEVTNQTTPQYSIITIKNYDEYQQVTSEMASDRPATDQPSTSDRPLCNKAKESNKAISKENKEKTGETPCPYSEIQSLYSSLCKSFPKLTKLSDTRKKAIHARFAAGYKLEDFKRLFELAEASPFLKGKNQRNWQATFDWLIKDANIAKVLDGNYNDKPGPATGQKPTYDISEYENSEVFENFDNFKR